MNISLVLGAAGLAVALLSLPVTLANWRRLRVERSAERFVRVYERVRLEQARLNQLALAATPTALRDDGIPLLTRPGWVFPQPQPLETIQLRWREQPAGTPETDRSRQNARRLMPLRNDGSPYPGYSSALAQLKDMGHLYNGWIYRPLKIEPSGRGLLIDFGEGRYFDHLDTTEVLAYEAAANDLVAKSITAGAYRRYLGDPFDLNRRLTSLGIITLTVRVADNACGFYMHQRDGEKVTVAPDLLHVIPAGEFTPADVGLESRKADFRIWHTCMREYAEEFLDVDEAYGRGGQPLDYTNSWPFKQLNEARAAGTLRLHVLGLGLDPLTWKPELLLVCAIDAPVFDQLFTAIVQQGKEGTVIAGPGGTGIPFNAANVDQYAGSPHARNAAQACLRLAWRHRVVLGLSGD